MSEQTSTTPDPSQLAGKRVIVAVCGGIAAYKVCEVVSRLVQMGCHVDVCMTASAQKFVTPLTFEALSGNRVRSDSFELVEPGDTQHIHLTEQADLMLVAPATANMLAKVTHGLCDDLVSLLICAAACPVVFAPAMNSRMWDNPITRQNVAALAKLGYSFIGPDSGWLACRATGSGRLSDAAKIVAELVRMLTQGGAMPSPVNRPG